MSTSTSEARGSALEPRQRGVSTMAAVEVALALVSLATVASMWRLFTDASYFPPLLLHGVAAHALVAVLRRRGTNVALSALVCLVAALLALTWGHLWATTALGLPTTETLRVAAAELETAWRTFGDVRAPAPVLTGFLLSAGAALWVGAWLADLAAFRLWTPFEALIPGGTVFVFASLFAADRARLLAGALWLATAFGFVLLHRTARQRSSPSWIGSDSRIGTNALVKVGAGLSISAVLLAVLVAPRLPGAEAEAIVPFAPEHQGGSRTTVSPLVEIRRRLVEQSQNELFTVEASDRAYWRLTALDIFDGEVWSSRGSFGDSDGELSGDGVEDVPTREVTQRFAISGLSAIWLPAAFEADDVEAGDVDVRWDDVSSTLIVSTDYPTSDGLFYEVTSRVPDFDAASLAAASPDVPGGIRERGLDLPGGFPDSVVAEAQRIVAGRSSPYDKARALQDSFRDGSFLYSLAAPEGHAASAIEEFLFLTRTGYCEQFAGTYAAMARAVGLPARVAVGFTPGEPDPSQPGRFVVRGEHAHAWPEVWIAGAGWVAFEPTPGRGAPGADYTGAEESQDAAGISTEATTVPTAPGAPAAPVPVPDPNAPGDPAAGPDPADDAAGNLDPIAEPDKPTPRVLVVARTVAIGVPIVVAALVAIGGLIAGGRFLLRRRRRNAAATPEDIVLAASRDLAEFVAALDLRQARNETASEFCRRLAGELHEPRLPRLGELVTRAQFDPEGVSERDAEEVGELVALAREAVRASTPWWRRVLTAMDPRPLSRRGRFARPPRPTGPRIQIRLAAARDT